MAPKDTTKGTKSAPASAPPDGAASKSGVAEKVAADVAAATAQVVGFPAYSPKPDCLVEVQQIQDPDNGLKENIKDAFVLHCMSEEGKDLRKRIVESFQSYGSLATVPETQMCAMWLESTLTNIECDCTGVDGGDPDDEAVKKASEMWEDIKRRVKAARLQAAPAKARMSAFAGAPTGTLLMPSSSASKSYDLYKGDKQPEGAGYSSSTMSKGEGKARAREEEEDRSSFQAKKARTAQTGGIKILQNRLQGKPRLSYILNPQLQLILATHEFIEHTLPALLALAGHGGTEAEIEVQEAADLLADKHQEALASYATCFAANDADNFNVTLAVADKFLNTGLGDFSDQALSALGVTPDQLQVVGSVVKESKDAKQVKKKAEHDPKLWCVTCGRRGHEAVNFYASKPAPGYAPNANGPQGPPNMRRDRDMSPPIRRRSRSPPRGGFYSRDRGARSPKR